MSGSRRGFTLMEMMVALTVSALVLVGIISIATTMARYRYAASLRGSATGGALYSLQRMQREIEDATSIALPAGGPPPTGDVVSGCTNWSNSNLGVDKRIDPNKAAPFPCTGTSPDQDNVVAFYYCRTPGNAFYRHYSCGRPNNGTACVIPTPTTCGTGGGAAGAAESVVPAKPGFYPMDNFTYLFKRPNDTQIELHYIVGNGTYSATNLSPTSIKVNVTLTTNKSYGGSAD